MRDETDLLSLVSERGLLIAIFVMTPASMYVDHGWTEPYFTGRA